MTEDHRRKLAYARGREGGPIVYSPRDGALPLNWPALLGTTPEFRPYLSGSNEEVSCTLTAPTAVNVMVQAYEGAGDGNVAFKLAGHVAQ